MLGNPRLAPMWWSVWHKSCRAFPAAITTTIYGQRAVANFGHLYPIAARQFPLYNGPLIELVSQIFRIRQVPLTFVDVGANIGVAVLLLESNCAGMIGRSYCVEGDPEYFAYLKENAKPFENIELFLALLSSEEGNEKTLQRTSGGSASAQGKGTVRSTTLDSLLLSQISGLDVLKIDVDGFDGRVLRGAQVTLRRHHPVVIFEWHPILCQQTGNSWKDHFTALIENGYERFVWFDKFGNFSHFMNRCDSVAIEWHAGLCLSNKVYDDWHYDIVALPSESPISPVDLAELRFARKRKWAF